jgi:hypothetical protein
MNCPLTLTKTSTTFFLRAQAQNKIKKRMNSHPSTPEPLPKLPPVHVTRPSEMTAKDDAAVDAASNHGKPWPRNIANIPGKDLDDLIEEMEAEELANQTAAQNQK